MSQPTVPPATSQQPATPGVSHQTARLLTAGIVAGPLFLAVFALQAFTRNGFDPGRHPLSLLSTHTAAWAGSRRTSALGSPRDKIACCCSSSAQPNGVCDIQLLHLARQACHVKGVARRSRSTIPHDAPCNPAQPSSRSCEARSSARRPRYCAPDVVVACGSPRLRRAATAARNPNCTAVAITMRMVRLSRSGHPLSTRAATRVATHARAQPRCPRTAKRRRNTKQTAVHDSSTTT